MKRWRSPNRFLRRGPARWRFVHWSRGLPRRMFSQPGIDLPPSSNYVTLTGVPDSTATLEQVFREEYGRINAALIRISGSFDLAEEALQEAFASAAAHWKQDGPPQNPGAWLTTVAHRKLLDAVRREKTKAEKQPELEYESTRLQPYDEPASLHRSEETVEYPDDRLRLIFICCHPSLSREAQVDRK